MNNELDIPQVVIKPSTIKDAGVGIFANKSFKKGDKVHIWGKRDIRSKKIKDIKRGEKFWFERFCVEDGKGSYTCPGDWKRMSIGWYINDSRTPNLVQDVWGNTTAVRNIKRGEELTIDYSLL